MVRLLKLSGLFLLLAALAPHTASAGVREQILRECQDGRITGHYTPKQLRDARNHIPSDVDEYSDCRDVLAQATLAGHSGGTGSSRASKAPGGVQPTTGRAPLTASDPVESQTLNDARRKSEAVTVGDQSLIPGAAQHEPDLGPRRALEREPAARSEADRGDRDRDAPGHGRAGADLHPLEDPRPRADARANAVGERGHVGGRTRTSRRMRRRRAG